MHLNIAVRLRDLDTHRNINRETRHICENMLPPTDLSFMNDDDDEKMNYDCWLDIRKVATVYFSSWYLFD